MSQSVEDRIVAMKFDNKSFEKGAATTMQTLGKLQKALDFGATAKGLELFKNGLGRFNLSGLGSPIDTVSAKFLGMATIGITALSRITNAAITAGTQLVKSFTIDPIKAGFSEYEANLNAVQTIMSATGESVETVTETLQELNRYSDKTIFSFSDMTANISKFTNAGMSSAAAKDVMIGIANAAASAGVNAEAAGRAMVGFGQSMSMGFVGLMDWTQVDNAGLATKEFKEELIASGVAAGTLTKQLDGTLVTAKGTEVNFKNFRETLKDQWLQADVLTDTLARYSDTSTEVGKKAAMNAQRVKTLTQLMGVLKESVGSGWSESFGIIFGNLEEATKLWTSVNDVIGGFIGKSAEARNKVLADWKEMDGRAHLIKGIRNVFWALYRIIAPIGQAFRDIFPAKTGAQLAEMSLGFRRFTRSLVVSKETSENIRSTFRGLFAILHIGTQILGGIIKYVFTFFQLLAGGGGSVFELTGSIGDLLVKIDEWLTKGDFIGKFFDGLIAARAAILGPIIDGISAIVSVLADLIGMGGETVFGVLSAGAKALAPVLQTVAQAIEYVLTLISELIAAGGTVVFETIGAGAKEVAKGLKKLGPVFRTIGGYLDSFVDSIGDISFESVGQFLGDIASAIGDLFGNLTGIDFPDLSGIFNFGGAADEASEAVDRSVNALSKLSIIGDVLMAGFQGVIQIFKGVGAIVGAAGMAIAAVFDFVADRIRGIPDDWDFQDTLALINTGLFATLVLMFRRFVGAFTGIGGALTETIGSAGGTFNQLTANLKSMQNEVRADMILKIAGAVAILTASIIALTLVKPEKLKLAVGTVVGLMVGLIGAMKLLDRGGPDTIKGATQQAASLTALSAAMVAMATAVLAMSAAVAVLGNMDASTLKKGLISIGLILAGITLMTMALSATGGGATMLAAAVALGILALAITALAGAIKLMDAIDTDTIRDGLTAIGVILLVIGGAMMAMQASIAGAVSLFIIANAIIALAGAIKLLAAMKTDTIRDGLTALVVIFGVLGLATLALSATIVPMLALSAAMLLLGLAFVAVGAGMALFSIALAALAVTGVAGFAALAAGILAFLQVLPLMIQQFGYAIVTMANVIVSSMPAIVQAMTAIVQGLLQTLINSLPKIGETALKIITTILDVIIKAAPKIANAGFKLLLAFLNAIAKNIGKVVKAATDIIVNFVNGIAKSIERIIQAGVNLLLAFLRGIAKAIRENDKDIIEAGLDIGKAIIEGLGQALEDGVGELGDIIGNLADKLIEKFKDKFKIFSPSRVMYGFGEDIVAGLGNAIDNDTKYAVQSMDNLGDETLASIRDTVSVIEDAMSMNLDTTPTITPVIDMAQFQKDAAAMSAMMGTPTISPGLSFTQASSIASQKAVEAAATQETRKDEPPVEQNITFIQNNTSPKALGEVEIYRNTRSQIRLAKEALNS